MPIDTYSLIARPIPGFEKLSYTFAHRRAFRYVLDTYFPDHPMYDELDYRTEMHDLDKCLYIALGGDLKAASEYHRATNPHHMESNANPTEMDLMEPIIDYECAGFTKADKPLNAYDTVIQWGKAHGAELIELMGRYGMDRSYDNTPYDEGWVSWNGGYVASEDDMLSEIDWFCQCEPAWAQRIIDEVRG